MMRHLLFFFLLSLPLQAVWLKSLEEAKSQAVKAGKEIYLVFTSQEVSGACVQLQKQLLSQEAFCQRVAERFILVNLDVPAPAREGEVSPRLGNEIIAKNFKVESYPSAFYLNEQGLSYASETGVIMTELEEFSARLIEMSDFYRKQKEALKLAYEKEGMARARAIVEVLKNAPQGGAEERFADEFTELASLDPEDSLGFQKPRLAEKGFRDLSEDLEEVFHKDSYEEATQRIDRYVEEFQPQGLLLQKVLFRKLAALSHAGQTEAAILTAEKIIIVDAESSHGKLAAQMLSRLEKK